MKTFQYSRVLKCRYKGTPLNNSIDKEKAPKGKCDRIDPFFQLQTVNERRKL